MKGLALIAVLLLVSTINVHGTTKSPKKRTADVHAPIGTIRGSFMTSRRGVPFFAARGIRYAEAPIGELRFKPPVPAKSWSFFDATKDGPSCPQPIDLQQSEDCLRLNVYTKNPNPTSNQTKSPVLVFFHPGGFYGSTGQSIVYGPQYLMDKDIVLVTINYRLQSFGFMSTGDSNVPGNMGLKDQVIALRWIQKNIGSFGGDANNVAISGYSAGSWSVSLHMVSPMSKGLFHRAIAMSGTVVNQTPLPSYQMDLAKKHATAVGCATNDTSEMVACMRTKPVESFTNTVNSLFEWHFYPILLWSPVVEPEIPGVERFLTDQPEKLYREGKFHQVPMILGQCKDEFAGLVVEWIEESNKGNNSYFEDLNNRWEELAPVLFQYERDTPRSRNISKELRKYYFNDQPVTRATVDGVAQLFADSVIGYQVHRLARLISRVSTKPIYYYEFAYQGRYSHNVWTDTQKPYGVVHHDDLLYLFYISVTFPYFNVTDPEFPTVERVTSMWTNFAKTGNPIPANDERFRNVQWTPLTATNNKYLKIGNELTMNTGLNAKRMALWDSLFPLELPTTQ